VDAKPSVAFMTVNTGVSYLGLLIFIAYHEFKAANALLPTPATAIILVLVGAEYETKFDYVSHKGEMRRMNEYHSMH